MSQSCFGFTTAPFERDIPVQSLYEAPQYAEALARLLHVCRKRSLAVLTGEAGSGKSTVLRLLHHRLDPNHYRFCYVADSRLTVRTFYTLAVSALGVEPPWALPQLKQVFRQVAGDLYEHQGKTVVLVIDEAQTLPTALLLELRFVLNFREDSYSPLALILVGETPLKATLQAYTLSGVRRRVETGYHLGGLNREETKAYIVHHLAQAGCTRPLFPDDVVSRIQEVSHGLPALINALCRGCLLDAGNRGQELVDGENLARVLSEQG